RQDQARRQPRGLDVLQGTAGEDRRRQRQRPGLREEGRLAMAINLPKLPFKLPHAPWERLGPRTRRVLRYTGMALLALVIFVFALQMTFPYNRVKDKIIEGLSDKYDVTIGGVERGFMP